MDASGAPHFLKNLHMTRAIDYTALALSMGCWDVRIKKGPRFSWPTTLEPEISRKNWNNAYHSYTWTIIILHALHTGQCVHIPLGQAAASMKPSKSWFLPMWHLVETSSDLVLAQNRRSRWHFKMKQHANIPKIWLPTTCKYVNIPLYRLEMLDFLNKTWDDYEGNGQAIV